MHEDDFELEDLGLVSPDDKSDNKEQSYDWPIEIQQRILSSLIHDGYFLHQGLSLVKPNHFREEAHRFICKAIFAFFEEHSAPPDADVLKMEIHQKIKDEVKRAIYLGELDAVLHAYEPGLATRTYWLNQITEFAKLQELRLSFTRSVNIISDPTVEDRWNQVYNTLEKVFLIQPNSEPGLDYFDTVQARYDRMMKAEEDQERFVTGFEPIDTRLGGGGLCRGEMAAYAAMSGVGKSLALVKSAKCNLQRGKNVCYLTLEMDEDKVAERFDTMLTNVAMRNLYHERESVFELLTADREYCGRLIIKQFAAGTADVNTIRAYLSQLALIDFKPDLLVVDYVGEFKDIAGLKTYESRQRLVRDLRGLAVEANLCVFTAMQINRSGRDAADQQGYIDDDSLADSYGQIRPLDALWTISQNSKEQNAGVGTIFISKHRSGESKQSFYFERDPHTLEMKPISTECYRLRIQNSEGKAQEDVMLHDLSDPDTFLPNGGGNS